MKSHLLFLFTVLYSTCCLGQTVGSIIQPKSYNLKNEVNKIIDSINAVSHFYKDNPQNDKDFSFNDSITEITSRLTEQVIGEIENAYNKCPTDSIFGVLKAIDESGFIPSKLAIKLTDKDFSTAIGKEAKEAFLQYKLKLQNSQNFLSTIDLNNDSLLIYDIENADTIKLVDILKKHASYKVLDLWGVWCAPCRIFNKQYQKHYFAWKEKGVDVLGIGINVDKDGLKKFLTAVKNDNTPWHQYIDINNGLYNKLKADGTPFQVLLDSQNHIIKKLSYDMEFDLKELYKK